MKLLRQKNRFISILLTICFTVGMLTGCNSESSKNNPPDYHQATQYTTEGKTTSLVPDETASGSLTIDMGWTFSTENIEKAKKIYQELYPNVELTFVEHNEDYTNEKWYAYVKSLQTELMAGRGPDVFLAVGEAIDQMKAMRAGAYADLTSYFEKDPAFNVSDFNQTVLYAGQYQGKQYMVPLTYYFPLMLTTQEIIEETGFQLGKCKDYFSTGDEIVRMFTALKESGRNFKPATVINDFNTPYFWPSYAGLPWLDYEGSKIRLSQEDTSRIYEQLKKLSPYLDRQKDTFQPYSNRMPYQRLAEQEILFNEERSQIMQILTNQIRPLAGSGETPVIFPYRNVDGGITANSISTIAVNKNCKSMENAYRFVKVMMSPEFNHFSEVGLQFPRRDGIPISNQALSAFVEELQLPPCHGTPQEGWVFLNGEPVPAKPISEELVKQFLGFIDKIDSVEFEVPITFTVIDKMKPHLYDNANFETCFQNALDTAEIYISE